MNHYDPFYNHSQTPPNQNGQPYYPPQPQNPPPAYRPTPPPSPYLAPQTYGAYPPPQAEARVLPTQRAELDRPPRRRGFFATVLPWKGDTFGDVLRKLIFIAALVTFLYFSGTLVNDIVIKAMNQNTAQEEYQGMYHPGADIGTDETAVDTNAPKVRLKAFDELYAQNKDIAGWIKINNTVIDYPVYQSAPEDPEYYLHRTPKHKQSNYGSIFMDSRIDMSTDDYRDVILYGHHMADGSMFAPISKYKKLDFYKKSPTVTFNSIYENAEWKVFSVFITNTDEKHGDVFYFIRTKFQDDNDFMGFVTQLRVRSMLDIPVDVQADDKILLLSTCSYEFEGFRTVVCARKVRPGESNKVDVSLAKKAENPLYPDIWYEKFGGTKPEVPQYGGDGDYTKEITADPFS